MTDNDINKGDIVKVLSAPDQPSMAGLIGTVMAVFDTYPEKKLKVYIKGQTMLYLKPTEVEVL